jgi:hypothetical protein
MWGVQHDQGKDSRGHKDKRRTKETEVMSVGHQLASRQYSKVSISARVLARKMWYIQEEVVKEVHEKT